MFGYSPEVLERFPRRWCWRQSTASAAGPATTEALITVEAVHDEAVAAVGAALASLRRLFADHLPEAALTMALLGPGRPTMEGDV